MIKWTYPKDTSIFKYLQVSVTHPIYKLRKSIKKWAQMEYTST